MVDASPENELRLLATGLAGLERLLSIVYAHPEIPFAHPDFGRPQDIRQTGEALLSAEILMAAAHPRVYMDRMATHLGRKGEERISDVWVGQMAVILGHVDDYRATGFLLTHFQSDNWLRRHQIVRALAAKNDEAAYRALEIALDDDEGVVRLEAIRGIVAVIHGEACS